MLHKTPAEKHHCCYSASTGPKYGQLFWMEHKHDTAFVLSPMQGKMMCSSHPGKLMRGSPELEITICKLPFKYLPLISLGQLTWLKLNLHWSLRRIAADRVSDLVHRGSRWEPWTEAKNKYDKNISTDFGKAEGPSECLGEGWPAPRRIYFPIPWALC